MQYRKFRRQQVDGFSPNLNVIVGKNAQGKTSLLESLYLATHLKGFRSNTTKEVIQYGSEEASVQIDLIKPTASSIRIGLVGARKQIRVDEKKIASKTKYPFLGSSVCFIPDDLLLIKGGPEARRNYIDDLIIARDPKLVSIYQQFQKILKQRNRLLKSFKEGQGDSLQLELWTSQFIEAAVQVYQQRAELLKVLEPCVGECYQQLFGVEESVSVEYLHGYDEEPTEKLVEQRLSRLVEAEKAIGYTLIGPHRDDFEFRIQDLVARHYASQGQIRSLIITLKVAQIELTQQSRGHKPILLLDDIISELDDDRVKCLVNYLALYDGQMFVTTAEMQKLQKLHEQFPDFQLFDLHKLAPKPWTEGSLNLPIRA